MQHFQHNLQKRIKQMTHTDNNTRNVIIIGAGPAGYTAAIYTARANLHPLLFQGDQPGGQLTITTEVENFPGFSKGIMGPDLMVEMENQARHFDADIRNGLVTSVDLTRYPFSLTIDNRETITSKTIIIASGAKAKLLDIPSEKYYMGYGVSACATCDGFFFKGKEVIIVGGGDSALEEANFLTKFATKVYVVHRRDKLKASKIMQDRAFKNSKIEFIWNSTIDEIVGTEKDGIRSVTGVQLRNILNNETHHKKIDGVFMAIGHSPNTQLFQHQLSLDEFGYIITKPGSTATSVKGVFAAGDVQDRIYRQAVTAAGTGCMAAIEVEKYLESLE